MQRFFGAKSSAPPPKSLDAQVTDLQAKISQQDVEIKKHELELSSLVAQRRKLRERSPAWEAFTRNKIRPVQAKKAKIEGLKRVLESQQMNLLNIQTTTTTVQNAVSTVAVIKQSKKELERQLGKMNVDKIERLQDDLADLMDASNEISEALGGVYDMDDVDEEELDAELEILAMDMPLEAEAQADGLPSFMVDEVPEFIDEAPKVAEGKVQEVAK